LVVDVLLQTGAAYVSIGRIISLYRMSLLCDDNVESLSRRGKSVSKKPMALCVTVFRCFVERSLESSSKPKYLMWGLQWMSVRRKRNAKTRYYEFNFIQIKLNFDPILGVQDNVAK
jgi:hypothetical protein